MTTTSDCIPVIEVDQWTSTDPALRTMTMDTFDMAALTAGDAGAAKVIFGGHARRCLVSPTDRPGMGTVWFRAGADGHLERWKATYDSSD